MPIKKLSDSELLELLHWKDKFKLSLGQMVYWLETEKQISITRQNLNYRIKRYYKDKETRF
jgi:hypothetical protein